MRQIHCFNGIRLSESLFLSNSNPVINLFWKLYNIKFIVCLSVHLIIYLFAQNCYYFAQQSITNFVLRLLDIQANKQLLVRGCLLDNSFHTDCYLENTNNKQTFLDDLLDNATKLNSLFATDPFPYKFILCFNKRIRL